MPPTPIIAIVIVSWNVRELLSRAVTSIEKEADVPFELFIIDNASLDGTAAYLENLRISHPLCARFQFIINPTGRGFAAGCNQGMKLAQSPYTLLFAPDAELFPNTLSTLITTAELYPQSGVIGGKILNENGTIQSSLSALPTPLGYLAGRLRWHKLFPRTKHLPAVFDYEHEAVVPYVKGALFLITPAAKKSVGLLDERFFIWFEETDYCNRVAKAGLTVVYTPLAQTMHIGLASMKKMSFWSRQLIWNNSLRAYFTKYFGWPTGLAIGILDPLAVIAGSLAARLKSKNVRD